MLDQRSPKVITIATIWYIVYDFLFVFYRHFVPKTPHFWYIPLQKCCELENRVRGPSRSLEISPFDRAHTTSYWRSIVTMALSPVVFEIFNVEKYWPWNLGQRSLKVIESGTIRYTVWGFLLVFFSNFVPKCTICEIFDFKNAVTLKTGLGVIQGHQKWYHLIRHT